MDTPASILCSTAASSHRSLEEVHGSIAVPAGAGRWRRWAAFAGPAYLISVGYMDPGNWATDIQGGSYFGYQLLWVLLMSNAMAVLLQVLSARLGLVTGRDLAQSCRDSYGPITRWALFLLCEVAIAACDLAEVLGTAIGLNLLTGLPLLIGVLLTGLDVFALLAIQRWGLRKMEALIVSLISIIGLAFIIETFMSHPAWGDVMRGFVPGKLSNDGGENSALYVAIGILGATVMPHNLYLHSALVQSRKVERSDAGLRQACRWNLFDIGIALNVAFLVNTAILVVAAAAFFYHVPSIRVDGVEQAHKLLESLLGGRLAKDAFAIALICAGQSSTVTGTLAGQVTMEGFLHFRMRPWLRRVVTRALAVGPAVATIWLAQRHSGGASSSDAADRLLVLSQVILSLQLAFAVVPLVRFTGSRRLMGDFANPAWLAALAWLVTAAIIGLNGKLVYDAVHDWLADSSHPHAVAIAVLVPAAALTMLLIYLLFHPDRDPKQIPVPSADAIARAALASRQLARVGAALEARPTDATMLAEAVALAKVHRASLVLLHVVEGVGGQFHGMMSDDAETRTDEQYMTALVARLRQELTDAGILVEAALGYGGVAREIVRLCGAERIDLLVMGGHGHRGLSDLVRGTTIDAVRHKLSIPILAVRPPKPE